MKYLVPKAQALDALAERHCDMDKKIAALVYDYWVKKRQQEGGPLLPRLWFEQPWKVRTCAVLHVAL